LHETKVRAYSSFCKPARRGRLVRQMPNASFQRIASGEPLNSNVALRKCNTNVGRESGQRWVPQRVPSASSARVVRPSVGGRRTAGVRRALLVGEVCAGCPSFGGQRAVGAHMAVKAAAGLWHRAVLTRRRPRSSVASPEPGGGHGQGGGLLAAAKPNPCFERTASPPLKFKR
jgi:hypothetical protein